MIEIYYVTFDNSLPIRVPVLKSSGYNDTPVPIANLPRAAFLSSGKIRRKSHIT